MFVIDRKLFSKNILFLLLHHCPNILIKHLSYLLSDHVFFLFTSFNLRE